MDWLLKYIVVSVLIKDDSVNWSENLTPSKGKLLNSRDTLEILNFLDSMSIDSLIEGMFIRIGLQ